MNNNNRKTKITLEKRTPNLVSLIDWHYVIKCQDFKVVKLILEKIIKGSRFYSPNNVEEKKSSNYERKHHKKKSRSFILLKTSMFFKVKPKNIGEKPLKTPITITKPLDNKLPMIRNKKPLEEKIDNRNGLLQISPKSIFLKPIFLRKKP